MSGQRRIVVLGGGISGLTFTYYLNAFKQKVLTSKGAVLPQVTVLEKGSRIGGWLQSYKDPTTGAVFEHGPRSLRGFGTEARSSMALVEELGLTDQVVATKRSEPAGKNRLVYCKGKLHPLPTGLRGLFTRSPLLGNKSLFGVGVGDMRTKPAPELKGVDESIHSFVSRRFGVKAAENLADPFVRGIIAGDVKDTSVMAMLPRLKAAEDQYGSVVLNLHKIKEPVAGAVEDSPLCRRALDEKWAMWSLRGGLGTIPIAIHKALVEQGVDVRTNSQCTRLQRNGDQLLVHTDSGVLEADVVVAAINAQTLSKLLSTDCKSLSTKLSTLPIFDVATATLEYKRSDTTNIPEAFGHLIPSAEGEENLGVIYDSKVFPVHDREDNSTTRLTVMVGGAWFDQVLGSDPSLPYIEEVAMRSIAKQLNITSQPVNVIANIIKNAIPQYPVGHPATIQSIDKQIQEENIPLSLIGPSYDNAGANHCMHRAKLQAVSLLSQWDVKDFQNAVSNAT